MLSYNTTSQTLDWYVTGDVSAGMAIHFWQHVPDSRLLEQSKHRGNSCIP